MNSRFKKNSVYGVTIAIIFIACTAIFFHYPIQIIDALNSEPVHGFDIRISIWRVIIEPLVGFLLFYLRADQPLLEFTVLLLWTVSLFLIISVIKVLFSKKNKGLYPILFSFGRWLMIVPLILNIWLGLLLIIILFPLPANTILNNTANGVLVNTHAHSEYSHDGIISQAGLLQWHDYNGFNAFFITDQNHYEETLEAVKDQEEGAFPKTPLIICGEEFSGSNHMTLLGLKRNFITKNLSDQEVIDLTHDDNGIVIVAHWFDGERKSIPYFLDLHVDGFEIANQGYGLKYDEQVFDKIVEACSENGLIMNGAVDYHGYGNACFVWNAFDIPGWHTMEYDEKKESVLEVLRNRDMSRIKVLLYNDRRVFERNQVFLSPVYTIISYFRTLNFWQVLSWIVWLVILRYMVLGMIEWNKNKDIPVEPLHILGMFALLSSLYILINGIDMLYKSHILTGYNDIYAEYGTMMLWSGVGFMLYLILLIIFEIRRIRKIISNTD